MDSKSKAPMFFETILQDTITQERLKIPPEFVREFGNGLSNPVIFKVPNGKTWQVEMSKFGEGQVWLAKGWVEFSEHYSLKYGHLLVFQYEGNSLFNVLIFDMSATEIEYPKNSGQSSKDDEEITDLISDMNIQELGGNVASSSRVDTRATNFTSSYPWFKIVFGKNRYLNVPLGFVKKHMEWETKTMMLKVEDKSWPAKFHVYQDKYMAALYGVASFLKDNSLKEGDLCILELISNDAFNVSIFRI